MLVLLTAVVIGLGAGLATGGRFRNLRSLDLELPWLVLAALILQVLAFSPVGQALGTTAAVSLHLASYVLLTWFVVVNRRRLGIVVAGVGLALNFATIAANGGHMPASRVALALAGVAYAGTAHNNSTVAGAGTRLGFLGDVFAVPAWVPAANVFSAGDVLIVAGIALLLAASLRGPRPVGEAG